MTDRKQITGLPQLDKFNPGDQLIVREQSSGSDKRFPAGSSVNYSFEDLVNAINNSAFYGDTAAGIAGTSDGEYFITPSPVAEEYAILYLNDSNAAVEQSRYPSSQGIAISLAGIGYEPIGDYAAGIEVTAYNQVIRESGEFWRAAASTSLPYTTTGAGMPEGGAFVNVGDAVLRQELGGDPAAGQGATLVNGATVYVSDVQALIGLTDPEDGRHYETTGYHPSSRVGGGTFYWDAGRSKTEHTGGSIIDPGKTWPDWSVDSEVEAWFTPAGSGAGCYVRTGERYTAFDFGAQNDGVNDQSRPAAALVAFNGSRKQTGMGAGNPGTTTEPKTHIPAGNYLLAADIMAGVFRNTTSIEGEQTNLFDSPQRSVQSAIRLAQDTEVKGITFRGFVNQMEIDTGNVNQSTINLEGNRHINPETAAVSFVGNTASTVFEMSNFQASLQAGTDACLIDVPAGGTGPDQMRLSTGFVQWNVSTTTIRHECVKGSGIISLNDILFVPLATVGDDSVEAAWAGMYRTSDEVHFNNCRLGGESGGTTAIHCLSEANSASSGSRSGIYINGGAFSMAQKPFIKFWKLPNVINIQGPVSIQNSLGLCFVESTDPTADATLGGMDFNALQSFAEGGEVWASSPRWLESNQYDMGTHSQLGYAMVWGKYYVSRGVPEKSAIDVEDIAVSGTIVDVGTGTTLSLINQNVAAPSSTDSRGVLVRTITCDGSASPSNGRSSRFRATWTNFFESSLIGASLDSADDVQFTLLVEAEYAPSKASGAHIDLQAALQQATIPLQKGRQTYALPFVYYNTTQADQSGADDMAVQVRNLQLNDEVVLGRIWIVRGFQKVDLFSLVATKIATGAPADIADAEFGFSGDYGWAKGDRVLVSQPGVGDDTGYICTAAQNSTAWSSLGTV